MALNNAQVEAFVDAIGQQKALYIEMIEMAGTQLELLEDNNTEAILTVLNKKQVAMDALDVIEQKIQPIKQHWDQVKQHIEPEPLAKAETALLELRETLGQLIELENSWKDQVDAKHLGTKEKLTNLNKGRRMNQAYGQQKKK